MNLGALGTGQSPRVLQVGPARVFGWAGDGAGLGGSESSSQKSKLLVTMGVQGPAALCAAGSSSALQLPSSILSAVICSGRNYLSPQHCQSHLSVVGQHLQVQRAPALDIKVFK